MLSVVDWEEQSDCGGLEASSLGIRRYFRLSIRSGEATLIFWWKDSIHFLMEPKISPISEMRIRANQISSLVTELHPLTNKLENADAQSSILRALFELTKQVEVVKKHLLRLEKDDGSTQL